MEKQSLQPASIGQPPQCLTTNDLPHILNILSPIASNCYALGLQLGVYYSQLENIAHNHSKCEDKLREIIAERLKQQSPLTWLDIVKALRADTLRENRLASEIENRLSCATIHGDSGCVSGESGPPVKKAKLHSEVRESSEPNYSGATVSVTCHSIPPSRLLQCSMPSQPRVSIPTHTLSSAQEAAGPVSSGVRSFTSQPSTTHSPHIHQRQSAGISSEADPFPVVSALSAIETSACNTTQSFAPSQGRVENISSTLATVEHIPPVALPMQSPAVNQVRVEEVKARITNFECEFSDLKSAARQELSDRESRESTFLGRFRDHLLDLPVSKRALHAKFFHENWNSILNAKSIQELYVILSCYSNYTNYGIILYIITRFCGEEVNKKMSEYRDSLKLFEMATTVDIYLHSISEYPDSEIWHRFSQMSMKINKPTYLCTLHEIRALMKSIAESAAVPHYCMYIGGITSSSVRVVLYMYIPQGCTREVADAMTLNLLQTHDLTDVSITGDGITHHIVDSSHHLCDSSPLYPTHPQPSFHVHFSFEFLASGHKSQYIKLYSPSMHPQQQWDLHYTLSQPLAQCRPHHLQHPPGQPRYALLIKPTQKAPSTTDSGSVSVLQNTVPPAMGPGLHPPARTLSQSCSALSQDHGSSGIISTQVEQHHVPPDPVPSHEMSIGERTYNTWTSAVPPLQLSTDCDSSSTDHLHSTTATSADIAGIQPKIIEEVINRHTSNLTKIIGENLTYFSDKFIEVGFIARDTSRNIISKQGIGDGDRGCQLLDCVITNCRISTDQKWFDKFVALVHHLYPSLASSMTSTFTSHREKIRDFAPHPSMHPSLQAQSCTKGRHSPAEVVGRQVIPHSEHTQLQGSLPSCIPPSPMQQFIGYVKTFYKGYEVERDPRVLKLSKTPAKIFINLVCIDRKSVGSSREYDEVTEAMVHDGNVDVVHGKKWPIDINKIAANLPATSLERVILVEGAPGVGKSTFAWEFCRRWERGEIGKEYQLVLLLRLREQRISNSKSLQDLIYHPSEAVCQAVITELESTLGVNTLIILEGFDELPDSCRTVPSVFLELIHGQLLPLATIIITSRPWATHVVHTDYSHRIFQHVEILGFNKQQIRDYISSVLPESEAMDLEAYIDKHPQIRAGMYIPRNSAIVVRVYQESKARGHSLPKTLTELYTALTLTLLNRYMQGHPIYGTKNPIRDIKKLPSTLNDKFSELCKLAYGGIAGTSDNVQLIFNDNDLPSEFDNLGFMDSVTELYDTQSSYNFLHLTFQEFLAAVHISNMIPAKQIEHFRIHKEHQFKVVLRFLAGLNKLDCFSKETVSYFLQIPSSQSCSWDVAPSISFVQWLFETQSTDVIEHALGQRTVMFYKSYLYSMLLPLDYFCLGYCIAHSKCKWILRLDDLNEDKVNMLAAGASTKRSTGGKVVGLSKIEELTYLEPKQINALSLSAQMFDMMITQWKSILFLHTLSLQLPDNCDDIKWQDLSSLRVLELEINGRTKPTPNTLSSLSLESLTVVLKSDRLDLLRDGCITVGNHVATTTTLKDLHICISPCYGFVWPYTQITYWLNEIKAITSALACNQLLQLRRLELECDCIFSATDVDSLAKYITNATTLQCFSVKCILHGKVEKITSALATNQSLRTLEKLQFELHCTFPITAAENLAQLLTSSTSLKHFAIENCTFTAHGLLLLVRKHNKMLHLKGLVLEIDGDNQVKNFHQLLSEYPTIMGGMRDWLSANLLSALRNHIRSILKELTLTNSNISDDIAVHIAQNLTHNKTLMTLNLSDNNISDVGAEELARALSDDSKLKKLTFSGNRISHAGTVKLAERLSENSSLTMLNLSNSKIGNAGAAELACILRVNSYLIKLNLSNNDISDTGTKELAQHLIHNSTLTELDLSNNSIGNDGAAAVAQALIDNSTLAELDLSNNSIGYYGAAAVAQALAHNSTLTELDLSNNSISNDGLAQTNSTLTELDLSNEEMSNAGTADVPFSLTLCASRMILDLSNNRMCDAGAAELVRFIIETSTVTDLYLSNNDISDTGAVALAQALQYNSTLAVLDLSNNCISRVGAKELALVLHNTIASGGQSPSNTSKDCGSVPQTRHHSILKVLELSNNVIHDDGAGLLAQALHHNSTVTELYVSGNNITDAGAEALAQALRHNSTLKKLNLSNNSISDAGAVALGEGLSHNSTLETLSLSSNNICDVGTLAQALHHSCTLVGLSLSNNCVSDAGATALANALHHNSTLKLLDLSTNNIGDDGTVNLAQALHHNSTLLSVTLLGNDGIGEVGTIEIVHALTVNTSVIGKGGLHLPIRCEQFATQCTEYHLVIDRMGYY